MFLSMRKTSCVRKAAASTPPSTRPCLEELESRVTPTPFSGTYTNAVVQVTPNFLAGTVTETVTANVTNAPTFDSISGVTTPVPPGAVTPSGTILFNLNNHQQQAQLNSNGQATASFTLPIFAVLTSQQLSVEYEGGPNSEPSAFNAPLYMNFDNLLLPATLTFGQLSPQQLTPSFNTTTGALTSLPPFNTAQGETDSMGLLRFGYTDPGVISSVDALGIDLPGMFAAALGAYGPLFSGQHSGGSTSSSG